MDTEIDIPEQADAAAPEEKTTKRGTGLTNFADKKKTVEKVLERAKLALQKYKTQTKRTVFEDTMKTADAMMRMAAAQTKQAENKTSDEMDCVPDIFFRVLRAITSNETDILVKPNDPPGEYEPLEYLDAALMTDAKANCVKQNLTLEYSRVMDGRKAKEEETIWRLNKYGNCVVGMEWYEQSHKTRERVPVRKSETGEIIYKWETKELTECYPKYSIYPIEDTWFDAELDDLQEQCVVLLRRYPLLSEAVARQEDGDYINVSKIKKQHCYNQEQPSDVRSERAANAGDDGDESAATGQLDEWTILIRAPITAEGKWDEKKTYPRWHLATFEGNIESLGDPVCVRLISNPTWWNKDKIPYALLHSHPDDNGAFHVGYATMMKSAYAEYKTTLDQWFYNKNLINAAPWIAEFGSIMSDNTEFGPHRLILMQQGMLDRIKKFPVQDNTTNIQMFIAYLEERIKDIGGANDTIMGEALGGRTSALESDRIYEAARKPGMNKLRYIANQLYPFMAEWDAAYWRQFAPPELTLALTREGVTQEIKPSTVWGPMRYKIVAIDQYEQTTIARHEEDRFLQVSLPVYAQIAGKKLTMKLFRYIYKQRKFPVNELMPETHDLDARHMAAMENQSFLSGEWVPPLAGQDHDLHLLSHENFKAVYKTLGKEMDREVLGLLETHEAMTRQLQQQEQAALAGVASDMQAQPGGGMAGQEGQGEEGMSPNLPGGPGMGSAETAPMDAGQESGDMLGGAGGGLFA